ncbi:MAG: NADPH-dependent F420 reductase [Anaerolineaceae bacterium]|nr:NADPH-dependent F420 reductase [Anaerolineaceae bacterium]
MEESKKIFKIAIIGGTGKEGKGLAYRWANAGHSVIIGSRNLEKAQKAVEDLKPLLRVSTDLKGMENEEAVSNCDIAVLTVPFSAHKDTLLGLRGQLAGKILIDVSVPINPDKVTRVSMPPEGSAGLQALSILGKDSLVATAFQNISYERLISQEKIECDVLVCGNGKTVRQVVLGLVKDAGLKGWDAGVLDNSMVVEGLTSILIGLNIQNKVPSSGIRITGIDRAE